jgi:hypothetical protein
MSFHKGAQKMTQRGLLEEGKNEKTKSFFIFQ